MTTVRRTLTSLLVLTAALAATVLLAGPATAQEPAPAPLPSLTESLDTAADPGNAFQQTRRQCLDMNPAENVDVPGLVGLATDAASALGFGDELNEIGCLEAATVINPGDAISTGVSSAASAFWGDPVGDFAKSVMEGNTQAFRSVMTFWMSSGIPGLAAENAMSGLRNIISGFTVVALFASIVIAMIKLAIARKQAVMEGATETATMLVRTVVTVSLLPILVLMFHQGGDIASAYALEKFVGGDLNEKITAITAFDDKIGLGPVFALACAGFAFLGSVAQLIALLIREAVLCVVVAIIPLAAAASATGTGRSSYKSMIAFTLGALLFKPVATLLYLFAFWAASSSSSDQIATVIIGSVLLAVIGFSLPALIRVVAPAAESISAGGREVGTLGQAGGAVTSGAAMSGARTLGSASSKASGSSGGSGGRAGSTGSAGTGARPAPGLQGRYTGSSGSSGSPGPSGATRGMAKGMATAGLTAASAGLAGAAGALKIAGSGARAVGNTAGTLGAAADGAIGNYHGRIQR
ncbi:hypothetical protein CH260_20540 [Rhodococcus sp. 05-2256-B2]|uniref:hypothetical protein n=1 Tax=unclassified Rhodococcus (in: high G+C Gram-positive bacteria) TaxID=192944 RepID=UPI000B9BC276|nr:MULTISPECIES: hypothetical protein [unclassified Rhodococcus (in: high G+C Gram-positive bacteria)]OZD85335.1 hypothetical protein CH258_14070 [Rhodococcus sp. 05-2256-B4]OZD92481.1 hypothetical protein CH260_20540 [Rhodococcus sp. 05-2256-B2]OZD99293.1 hypothetical protein CH257_00560 [Rhodococcus sp. 05-2256-B3]OZE02817.1 hypothetical protein CH285_12675 [Rhodococcus sp. 05-2256-B1]